MSFSLRTARFSKTMKYFFTPTSNFGQPAKPGSIICRYLTLFKFRSLLQKNALFFTRLDALGDPWEGASTWKNVAWRKRCDELRREMKLPPLRKSRVLPENTIVNSCGTCGWFTQGTRLET